MRRAALLVTVLLAANFGGCYRRVGPVVRNVQLGPDGAILVERCTLHVAPPTLPLPLMPGEYELQDCDTKPAQKGPLVGQ